MNWTAILARAGVPEPPGRAEAVARWQERRGAVLAQRRALEEERQEKELERQHRRGLTAKGYDRARRGGRAS